MIAYAHGSWGSIEFVAETGHVQRYTPSEPLTDEEPGYRDIERIDVDEWRRTYPDEQFTDADILDLGYWLNNGRYEPPVADWRAELRRA